MKRFTIISVIALLLGIVSFLSCMQRFFCFLHLQQNFFIARL